jgi:hypothetical protein
MPDLIQKYSQMVRVSRGLDPPNQVGFAEPVPSDKDKIDWIYGVLTILDAKAGALLAFNGLLIAAATLTYDKFPEKALFIALILLSLFASLLSLYVARVSYEFLGNIIPGQCNNQSELDVLEDVAEKRTRILFVAWSMSVFSVYCYIAVALYHMIDILKLK